MEHSELIFVFNVPEYDLKKKGIQPFDTNTHQAALIDFANDVPEISLKDVHLPLTTKSTYLMESMIKSKN